MAGGEFCGNATMCAAALYLLKGGADKAGSAPAGSPESAAARTVTVKVKDNGMVGEVVRVSNKAVTVAVGNITSKMPLDKVERISSNEYKAARKESVTPRSVIDNSGLRERRLRFSPELDVRGERVSDALDIVIHYIDDAVMLGVGSVRIIHGKGTGALRDELQKYLRTVPGVGSVHDEHIQFGGSGVTIVEFE